MHELIPTGEATAILPTGGKTKPITVIGTEAIRSTFDEICLQQAINSRLAPGRHRPRAQSRRPLRLRRAGRLRARLADARLSRARSASTSSAR